jgi:hypothetical protein
MRRSGLLRAAVIAAGLTAALAVGACSTARNEDFGKIPPIASSAPWHPERNPLYEVPRNGANQPVDQYGVPLPGYALQPR